MNKLIQITAFSFASLCAAHAFAAGSSSTVTTSNAATSAEAPTAQRNVPTVAQYLSPVSNAPVASHVSVPSHARPVEKQHMRHPKGMQRHPGAVNTAASTKAS